MTLHEETIVHDEQRHDLATEAADKFADALLSAPSRRRSLYDTSASGWYTPTFAQRANELLDHHQLDALEDPRTFVKALITAIERGISDAAYDERNKA